MKIDWAKLSAYNEAITTRILKRLPKDWHLSRDEIKSEVNDSFIRLIKIFVPKLDGRSLTSWCYQYAEKITMNKLMKEYNRLKKQVAYDEAFFDKYDKTDSLTQQQYFCHQYGHYDVKAYTTIDSQIKTNDILDVIANTFDLIDAQIIKMKLICDMSQNEIAKKLNMKQTTISFRLKRCLAKVNKFASI